MAQIDLINFLEQANSFAAHHCGEHYLSFLSDLIHFGKNSSPCPRVIAQLAQVIILRREMSLLRLAKNYINKETLLGKRKTKKDIKEWFT